MAGGPGGQSVAGGPGVVECDWPGRLLFRSWSSISMSRFGAGLVHDIQLAGLVQLCDNWEGGVLQLQAVYYY